jgi:hypothetical protein
MKTTKEVTVLCRYAHKTNGKLNGTVTYCVRSSNGKDFYYTTLVEGKASGCSCPAKAGCYHKKQLENKEQARPFAAKSLPTWAVKLVNTGKLEVPGKAKVVVLLTEKVRKPRKYATEMLEATEHKASILAECREIKERREADMMSAALTTNQGFSILR